MTHASLTAELHSADEAIAHCTRTAEYFQAIANVEQARRDKLNQLLADLDCKQVTPRQIERYPVLSPREAKAFIKAVDDAVALAGETLLTVPMGGEVGK